MIYNNTIHPSFFIFSICFVSLFILLLSLLQLFLQLLDLTLFDAIYSDMPNFNLL